MSGRKDKVVTQWDVVDSGTLYVPCSHCNAELSFKGRNDSRAYLRCGHCDKLTALTDERRNAAASKMLDRIHRFYGRRT